MHVKLKKITFDQLKDYDIQIFAPLIFDDDRGQMTVRIEDQLPDKFLYGDYFSFKSTKSHTHVARGLHWQNSNHPVIKYIDLKQGHMHTVLLDTNTNQGVIFHWTDTIGKIIKIPENFAHGFYCVTDCVFQYICKGKYSTADEVTFNVFPSICKIMDLPRPLLSEKDSAYPKIEVIIE